MKKRCIRCGEKGFVYLGLKSNKDGKAVQDIQTFCMMCKPLGWMRKNKKMDKEIENKSNAIIEYANFKDLRKIKVSEEETELKGVKNYQLKSLYAPVLDKKFIKKFNPKKTCISVCGNKKFEFDEDKLIKETIKQVEELKDYYEINTHENIGEFSIFQNINVNSFMLESYSFDRDADGDYYLILWFTPTYLFNGVRKHVYWYGKKNNMEFY